MEILKKILRIIFNIFFAFLIIILLLLLKSKYIDKDKVPSAFGFSILKVASGSMIPSINVGDYIIIKSQKNYEVDDVVSYINKDKNIITHRIIDINNNLVTTKGDNNNVSDDEFDIKNIKGKVVFKIYNFLPDNKFVLVLLLISIFMIDFGITFLIQNKKKG